MVMHNSVPGFLLHEMKKNHPERLPTQAAVSQCQTIARVLFCVTITVKFVLSFRFLEDALNFHI